MLWKKCRSAAVVFTVLCLASCLAYCADVVVETIEQATMLDEKMKATGVTHTLTVFKGQEHGFAGEHQHKAMNAMWEFFGQNLNPQRPSE